ncbi:MAG TPA: hypothetical protein VHT00_18115 [Stellaceae bacterium]|jgi:hypothetical protein|nr:hypothetical protein [Stellaceae bacterium]
MALNCAMIGFLDADEIFIGGRGDPTGPERTTANPDKSLVVAAVEKVRLRRSAGFPRRFPAAG